MFLLSTFGCSHVNIPFLSKSSDQTSKAQPAPVLTEFVDEGLIVNAQKLKQGRNIAIIPFTAGVGAVSTDDLDRAALMIVKGVSDAFADDKTGKHAHFNLLTVENSKDADLVVKGHIIAMSEPSKFKKWTPLSNKRKLSVEGKITDIQSGETVVIFTDHEQAKAKDDGFKQLGYDIGKNIGRFILSGIQ